MCVHFCFPPKAASLALPENLVYQDLEDHQETKDTMVTEVYTHSHIK